MRSAALSSRVIGHFTASFGIHLRYLVSPRSPHFKGLWTPSFGCLSGWAYGTGWRRLGPWVYFTLIFMDVIFMHVLGFVSFGFWEDFAFAF